MTKPIIDHYGAYVTEPEANSIMFGIMLNGIQMGKEGTIHQLYYARNKFSIAGIYNKGNLYATRKAAEMALIRAKALQRLKAMAYGDGWLPLHALGGINIVVRDECDIPFRVGVMVETIMLKEDVEATITPEEKEAFLYVYNPEEKG